jgi:inner membrane protein
MEKQNEKGFMERMNQWFKTSVTVKIVSIGILILVLLIPTAMVQDLINERQYRKNDAKREVTSKWGSDQVIGGPVITLPVTVYDKGKQWTKYVHILPDKLEYNTTIEPQPRYRGIYEVMLYRSAIDFSGGFRPKLLSDLNIDPDAVRWDEAFVSVGISDMRGISENVIMKWDREEITFEPGILTDQVFRSGLSAKVPVMADDSLGTKLLTFRMKIMLNGSDRLTFIPMGKETTVNATSPWPHPSFDGAFLPVQRKITEQGFDAQWKVLHLNRNYPQVWHGTSHDLYNSNFGVNLINPVDEYTKTDRSAKYANMFIVLTFLIFFFTEVLNKTRIHAFQYFLVGIALVIFYVLLLSISEHLGFNTAYAIASVAVIGMVTLYAKSVLVRNSLAGITSILLTVLYLFLFSLLQLQDYSLLMGSIGLFLILAVVMYLSRKINWSGDEQDE